MRKFLRNSFLLVALQMPILLVAQTGIGLGSSSKKNKKVDILAPETYTIGGVTISGSRFLDEELLISISGLQAGDKITLPYDQKISKAIQNMQTIFRII